MIILRSTGVRRIVYSVGPSSYESILL
jgi:hypothetical protein